MFRELNPPRFWPVLLAAGGLFLLSPVAVCRDYPENIGEIEIRDVMWQALPEDVFSVFIGPDDRTWFELRHPDQDEDLDNVKRIIRREFSKPAPQLFGCRPALFEPDGRVWFVTESRRVLLGYDGRDLIERRLDKGHFVTGNCPNHGRVQGGGFNLFVAGTAFFIESRGILTYGNGRWNFPPLALADPEGRNPPVNPIVSVEPDGKGVVACLQGLKKHSIWHWRRDRWSPIDVPPPIDARVRFVVPRDRGVWLFTRKGILFSPEPTHLSTEFNRLLEKLGSDSYQEREKATDAMTDLGPSILPLSAKAHTDTDDLEVLIRLERVILRLKTMDTEYVSLGPFRLRSMNLIHTGIDGTAYIASLEIRQGGKSLGAGILASDGKGTCKAVMVRDLFWAFRVDPGKDNSGPLVLKSGSLIWIPQCDRAGGARLLDMDKKAFVAEIPDPRFYWLHAVRSDGTVFVGWGETNSSCGAPLMVYRQDAPDTQRRLKSEKVEIGCEDDFCIGSDGTVWAASPDRGPIRFDGRDWREVPLMKGENEFHQFLTGGHGAAIISSSSSCALVVGDRVVQRNSAKELVRECKKDIVKYFRKGSLSRWFGLAVDRAGHIWMRETRELSVLVADRWLNAAGALKRAGSLTGDIEYIGPCGNGEKVYVGVLNRVPGRNQSFFGKVSEGRIVFTEAPKSRDDAVLHLNVRDSDGGLWVPGALRIGMGTGSRTSGQRAYRITKECAVQEWRNCGWAKLHDRSGNVWLGQIWGERENRFHIWREGRIAHSLSIAGATANSSLISDKPGSVFLWTRLGLQRMVACDPKKPGRYVPGRLYRLYLIPKLKGDVIRMGYSKLGYAVLTTFDETANEYSLHLVRIPEKD